MQQMELSRDVAQEGPVREGVRSLVRRRLADPRALISIVCMVVVAYLALVPLVTLVVASLRSDFLGTGESTWTLQNYVSTLGGETFLKLLATSLEYSLMVTVVAVAGGFVLAWLYVRTNTPGKSFILFSALAPLIIPGLLSAAAWVLLLSPRTGPINTVLQHLHLPEFNIYSLAGMVFVQSIHVLPIAFLMGLSTLSSMDRSLEEAAAASGARPRQVLRLVVVPLLRPAVVGVALISFVLTISSFEVPQLIGVPARTWVLTTDIYNATSQFPVLYGRVAVLGSVVFVIALAGLYLSGLAGRGKGLATVTGKGFRPSIHILGRWRWAAVAVVVLFGLVSVVLPVLMLAWSSLLPLYANPSLDALGKLGLSNYRSILDSSTLLHSLENTLMIAAVTGLIVSLLCSVIAYILVKTELPGRRLLNGLATAPIAIPQVIIGVSLLYWYLVAPLPVQLYGSRTILVLAFVTGLIPVGLRFAVASMTQISTELEEAAMNSGARWRQVLVRIYFPLLRPALVSIFLYSFVVASRELTTALFLYSPKSEVVAVTMYSMWIYGSYTEVCAVGMLMLLILALAVLVVRKLSSRVGIRPESLVR